MAYDDAIKAKAMKMYYSDVPIPVIASQLKVSNSAIKRWIRKTKNDPLAGEHQNDTENDTEKDLFDDGASKLIADYHLKLKRYAQDGIALQQRLLSRALGMVDTMDGADGYYALMAFLKENRMSTQQVADLSGMSKDVSVSNSDLHDIASAIREAHDKATEDE